MCPLLSPRARVWVNEDLTKIKESLDYECRLRYKGGKIYRCWTFSGDVNDQITEDSEPLKIDKITDLPDITKLDDETDKMLRQPRPEPKANFRQLRINRAALMRGPGNRPRRPSTGDYVRAYS